MDGYNYIRPFLSSNADIRRYFYGRLNDFHYVEKSIEGRTIIDAGCGSGAFSIMLGLLGAKRVYAVDYIAGCIDMTKVLIEISELKNVEVICGDIGKLHLTKGSVDGIFCIESISHYRDYKSFLDMSSRVLRTDGFLIIRDGNNGMSPVIRKKNYKIWDIFENYPGAITISGHQKGEGYYLNGRRNIIRSEFPSLRQDEVETFARYTFAYSKERIIGAVEQFMKGDFTLRSEYSYGQCPLDPETDCYMEQLFNPKVLKDELRNYGFKSKVYSAGPSKKSLRVLRFLWEKLSPMTIYLPRAFKIIAIRERK